MSADEWRLQVQRTVNGLWLWRVTADGGWQVAASSSAYHTREDAVRNGNYWIAENAEPNPNRWEDAG